MFLRQANVRSRSHGRRLSVLCHNKRTVQANARTARSHISRIILTFLIRNEPGQNNTKGCYDVASLCVFPVYNIRKEGTISQISRSWLRLQPGHP